MNACGWCEASHICSMCTLYPSLSDQPWPWCVAAIMKGACCGDRAWEGGHGHRKDQCTHSMEQPYKLACCIALHVAWRVVRQWYITLSVCAPPRQNSLENNVPSRRRAPKMATEEEEYIVASMHFSRITPTHLISARTRRGA